MEIRLLLEQLDSLAAEIDALVFAPAIADAANRTGNRARSAVLLEEAFVSLVTAVSPDLSVEIGAHEASFSKQVSACVPGAYAMAFEANPHVFRAFRQELTGLGIDYRNCAICAQSGEVSFYIPRKWSGGEFSAVNPISSLLQRNEDTFEYDKVPVPGFTLDDVLKNVEYARSVAWIDAEGAQRQILQGAPGFLRRTAAVFIELESREVWKGQDEAASIARLLRQAGFRPAMRDNIARAQFNVVYVRKEPDILGPAVQIAARYVERLRSLVT